MNRLLLLALCLGSITMFTACDDEDPQLNYDIPETYAEFENVSYDGQTQRLDMLSEIKSYLQSANTPGVTLDADRLKAMYENNIADAAWSGTYDDSKQLRSKTFESEVPVFLSLMEDIADASTSTVAGSEGQSGVVVSLDGTKQYLLNAEGIEITQLIEKGLMGAVFYYQAVQVYLGDSRMNVDNETVIPGEGTDMEHHWDEAFGYWGVPEDFPANRNGVRFWGHYTNGRDPLLDVNQKLMDAFLKGRAAITNNDLETRDEAITEVRKYWEEVVAGTALHYINGGLEKYDDMSLRAHNLSEAVAFIYSLQFNPEAKVSLTQVYELLTLVAGSEDFEEMNLYQVSREDLQQAADLMSQYYDWAAIKDLF